MAEEFRREYKYIITTNEFLQLSSGLKDVLKVDDHGEKGCYQVRSLYFDSLYDRDYTESISGLLEKRKIRVRIYPPNFEDIRVEWKCKEGQAGIKYDMKMTRNEVEHMMYGQFSFLAEKTDTVSKALYMRLMCGGYRPKTIVEYKRQAYWYAPSEVRITFDTYIKGTLTGMGLFDQNLVAVPLIDYTSGILEIKYTQFLPDTIKRLIGKLDRMQIANSKYIQARNLL